MMGRGWAGTEGGGAGMGQGWKVMGQGQGRGGTGMDTDMCFGKVLASLKCAKYLQLTPRLWEETRFLQKIKFLPNDILMVGTFRYILSHVKYNIS
jgi:hypothetical protein